MWMKSEIYCLALQILKNQGNTVLRIRLALVVELIRKTNADRFRRFDDILSSLSRN